MRIYRTKPNKFGWRIKFKLCDLYFQIIHENNHKGYWRESRLRGHNCFIEREYISELIEFLMSDE